MTALSHQIVAKGQEVLDAEFVETGLYGHFTIVGNTHRKPLEGDTAPWDAVAFWGSYHIVSNHVLR